MSASDAGVFMELTAAELDYVEEQLGLRFARPRLLALALTHVSQQGPGRSSNERLEYLGDAILGSVVAEYLFRELPQADEGELTRIKSQVVSTASLAGAFMRLKLDGLVRRSDRHVAPFTTRMQAGVFEALVAAIYLDHGIEVARRMILMVLRRELSRVMSGRSEINYKSRLQELIQRRRHPPPVYRLLSRTGPAHESRFNIAAVAAGIVFPAAWGRTKKEAEQEAARLALEQLEQES